MQNLINSCIRFWNSLFRPSKLGNYRRLKHRGHSLDKVFIRELTTEDVSALADLHAITWAQTYGKGGASREIREQQWRKLFEEPAREWFILAVVNSAGNLVGFAKGQAYQHPDLPDFNSELNKIYLRRDYQRLGLGRKLLGEVAQRLLATGKTNMVLFSTPQNPSGAFFEALGAKRLYDQKGIFQGGYAWSDLQALIKACTK